MRLTSRAFEEGEKIPARYTCEGQNLSPPLAWSEVPAEARSLALLVDDPDARGWVHWLVYDLPADLTELPEAATLPQGAKEGRTDFKKTTYGGPCPPRGTHRYSFRLYALDGPLELAPGADKQTALDAMKGHVLAEAQLTGSFARG